MHYLAILIGAWSMVACGSDEAKKVQAAAKAQVKDVVGNSGELSTAFEFLKDQGLANLQNTGKNLPDLSMVKLSGDDPALAIVNAASLGRLNINADVDRALHGALEPVMEHFKQIDWSKALRGDLFLTDGDQGLALAASDLNFTVKLPELPGLPSRLVVRSESKETTYLNLTAYWPATTDLLEKGLDLKIEIKDGKPILLAMYDLNKLAALTGSVIGECPSNGVQVRVDVGEKPRLRLDMSECAGSQSVAKSIWLEQGLGHVKLAGRLSSLETVVFTAVTDLAGVPTVASDFGIAEGSPTITSMSGFMQEHGLGAFIDRFIRQNFWNPAELLKGSGLMATVCAAKQMAGSSVPPACAEGASEQSLAEQLKAYRGALPDGEQTAAARTGIDTLLKILELNNPVGFAGQLSFGTWPESLNALQPAYHEFRAALDQDLSFSSGNFIGEKVEDKSLPKAVN